MRFRCLSSVLVVCACMGLSIAQETSGGVAVRDPRALEIINESLNAAGGVAALDAIHDYSGSGTITYKGEINDIQGNVVVKSRGRQQIRLDVTLPEGSRTTLVTNGSGSVAEPDGSVQLLPHRGTLGRNAMFFPGIRLLAALRDTSANISYVGIVQHHGMRVHDVRVQGDHPLNSRSAKDPCGTEVCDFFVEPNSSFVVGILERRSSTPLGRASAHEILFSHYTLINGLAVPRTLTEAVRGQHLFTIQLSQIGFNTGLTGADFER